VVFGDGQPETNPLAGTCSSCGITISVPHRFLSTSSRTSVSVRSLNTLPQAISYPVLLAVVLSPFTFVMNLAFPYWDFVFTLVGGLSFGRWVTEGLVATLVTTAMLVYSFAFAELLYRRIFCCKRVERITPATPQAGTVKVWPSHSELLIPRPNRMANLT
jgi:hypothetical protein